MMAIAVILFLGGCSVPENSPVVIDTFFPPQSDLSPQIGIVTGRYYYEMAADPRARLDDYYQLGLHWIRIEFEEFWDSRPGGGYATSYDDPIVTEKVEVYRSIIAAAQERHIHVLGVIGVNAMPGQLSFNEDGTLTQNALDRYLAAVEWHLETYDIDAIEIWNEPWGYGFGSASGDTTLLKGYGQLMTRTYETHKTNYPDVLFVAPVTANAEQGEWLGHHGWDTTYRFAPEESIFNNSIVQAYRNANDDALPLDVISWHPYGTGGDPIGSFYYGRDFETYYRTIIGELAMYVAGAPNDQVVFEDFAGRPIAGDYPIWFTEWGWNTNRVAESLQARYTSDMIAVMRDYPQIEAAMLYTYQDDEDTADSEGYAYGIVGDSATGYRRKSAYFELMGHATGVGFRSDDTIDRTFIDAYVAGGGKHRLGLPTGASIPIVENTDGTAYQNLTGGARGEVTLFRDASGRVIIQDNP